MAEEKGWKDGLTRRRLLGGAVGLAAVGGAGFGALSFGTGEATAQASGVTPSDVSIDSNDGTVTELYANPTLDVTWSNFEGDVVEVSITIHAVLSEGASGAFIGPDRHKVSSPGASGTETIDVGKNSMLESSGGAIAASDLEDTTEGDGATETIVYVEAFANFIDSTGSPLDPTAVADSQFTVSVNNLESTESTVTLGGTLNTGGN